MRGRGIEGVLEGWKPSAPLIDADTKVVAFGSCFASHFVLWLGDHGFNRGARTSPYDMLLRYGFAFENVPVVAQQFRWAFGEFDGSRALWIDHDKQLVEATEEQRRSVRTTLEDADVLILTLGLSEVWYDTITGEPLWRAIPARYFDERRHDFRVLTVAETAASLQEIHRLREQFLPRLKIIFTVSPVRLRATFRPISALTANAASKAILRAALDEFLRAHEDSLGKTYFYFPSYELVTDAAREPFTRDNRHLYQSVVDRTLALFTRFYTSLPAGAATRDDAPPEPHVEGLELMETIHELEASNAQLQAVCDERQRVIEELDRAARERLALIERLTVQCDDYRRSCEERAAVIERLSSGR
jgi:GSCFA family